ncbi:MAG: COX15/CtaA family protein [Xanthobacteraceae bacterium]
MAVADLSLLQAQAAARPEATGTPVAPVTGQPTRLFFSVLAGLGLAAFILNVDNRFTVGGLFFYPPAVDLIPPLTSARWDQAFLLHQSDPVFAACGGTESLGQFQTLYVWEWLRQASMLILVLIAAAGTAAAVARPQWRCALPRAAGVGLIAVIYFIATLLLGFAVAHIADLSRFNVGQYRHAVEVSFASAGVAALVVSAIGPPVVSSPPRSTAGQWLWIGAILLDIAFGAVFAARDATAVWTSLGYDGAALPPLDRLLSYSPLWLNPFVNQYAIQLIHRALSIGLYLSALVALLWAIRRKAAVGPAAALFLLMNLQMATGIGALTLGTPPVLSIVHQVGAIFLLAAGWIFGARTRIVEWGVKGLGAKDALVA